MNKIKYIIADDTQGALPYIYDHIKKQRNLNDRVAFCTFLIGICLVITDKIIRKQNQKIEELSKEVQELKQARGE